MKKWLWLLAVLALAGCKPSEQVDSDAAPAEKVAEAPAEENKEAPAESGHGDWLTDFEKAKAVAKEQNKHVLIDFSGSDWCGWCIKLDKEVFQKQSFKDYADENLVLMLADFPSDKSGQSAELVAQNEKLGKEFGVRGFPTVFILNPEGDIVEKTGYQAGGPDAYVSHIKDIIAKGAEE